MLRVDRETLTFVFHAWLCLALVLAAAFLYGGCITVPKAPQLERPEGFYGVVPYPADTDIQNGVYCGCAISCDTTGPYVTGDRLDVCMKPPEGCASRAIVCPAPGAEV